MTSGRIKCSASAVRLAGPCISDSVAQRTSLHAVHTRLNYTALTHGQANGDIVSVLQPSGA
jgi:hypothetical protein